MSQPTKEDQSELTIKESATTITVADSPESPPPAPQVERELAAKDLLTDEQLESSDGEMGVGEDDEVQDDDADDIGDPEDEDMDEFADYVCAKCDDIVDDSKYVSLNGCEHIFHVWCLIMMTSSTSNMCPICRNPDHQNFPSSPYVFTSMFTPPRAFPATYVIMDILLRSLGSKSPHQCEKYHRYRQILGLRDDQSNPVSTPHHNLTHGLTTKQTELLIKILMEDRCKRRLCFEIDEKKLKTLGFDGFGYNEKNISVMKTLIKEDMTPSMLKRIPFEVRLERLGHNIMKMVPPKGFPGNV